jgi:hypothetical protein
LADPLADRLRSLLGSDVYTQKGRLRSDDLLVRERACHSLSDAAAQVKQLSSRWRTERVPPSTREQPFPPAEVMEPLRRADRLGRAIEDVSTEIRGLPLLSQDKVWDRVRGGMALSELLQFDWALVAEAEAVTEVLSRAADLAGIDMPSLDERLARLRVVIAERRRYAQVPA